MYSNVIDRQLLDFHTSFFKSNESCCTLAGVYHRIGLSFKKKIIA